MCILTPKTRHFGITSDVVQLFPFHHVPRRLGKNNHAAYAAIFKPNETQSVKKMAPKTGDVFPLDETLSTFLWKQKQSKGYPPPPNSCFIVQAQPGSHLSPEELLGVFFTEGTLGKTSLAAGDSFGFGSRRRRLTGEMERQSSHY